MRAVLGGLLFFAFILDVYSRMIVDSAQMRTAWSFDALRMAFGTTSTAPTSPWSRIPTRAAGPIQSVLTTLGQEELRWGQDGFMLGAC